MKTNIYKGRDGWQAESMTEANANGEAWQISTHKGFGCVKCSAIKGNYSNGCFSYDMFGAKRLELAKTDGQCNEAKVKQVHESGLIEFEKIISEQPENITPLYVIGIGQVIFTDFIQGGDETRRVIYEIESPGNYKTVSLDGKELLFDDHIRPHSEKFGIGVYYNENEILSKEEVFKLVEAAKLYQKQQAETEKIKSDAAKLKRLADIENGSKIISAIPSGVTHVIIAESHINESDLQSDYHGHSVKELIYLAFSTHGRDLFPELRKAAANYEETKYLSIAPVCPDDQSPECWHPEDEHREKYSMGAGYYLGDYKHSTGWCIKKISVSTGDNYGVKLEALQIAAANGCYFIPTEQETEEVKEAPNFVPVEVEAGTVQIIDYSDKAIAVIGDTKPIKDKLKELGGRFNFRLTCGAGWIFPKTKLTEVQKALSPVC